MIESVARLLGPLTGLVPVLIGAAIVILLIIGMNLLAGRRSKRGGGRAVKPRPGRKARKTRSASSIHKSSEFIAIVGTTRRRYYGRYALLGVGIGVAAFLMLGSWGLSLVAFVGTLYVVHSLAGRKVSRAQGQTLDKELVPAAGYIERALGRGTPLVSILAEIAQGDDSPFKRALRRAIVSTRDLGTGLRAEADAADLEIVGEFFDILADSASGQEVGTRQAAMQRFVEVSRQRRTAYSKVLSVSAQARGTRTMMMMLVPGIFILMTGSSDGTLFRSTIGNVLIVAIAVLIGVGVMLSDFVINKAAKSF